LPSLFTAHPFTALRLTKKTRLFAIAAQDSTRRTGRLQIFGLLPENIGSAFSRWMLIFAL